MRRRRGRRLGGIRATALGGRLVPARLAGLSLAVVLMAGACSGSVDPAPDVLGDEDGWMAVEVFVTGERSRELSGWWSPARDETVLMDADGVEALRVKGKSVTVPSFLPDTTTPRTTFDLAGLDRAVAAGLSPYHSEGSDLDLVLWVAPVGVHPSIGASASLLDAALARDPEGGEIKLGSEAVNAAWPTSVRTTMLLDCGAGLDTDVVVGDGTWSISHPMPLLLDPDRAVRVEFARTDSDPPAPDDAETLVLPDPGAVDRLEPRPPAVPCSEPAVDDVVAVDCGSLGPSTERRGPDDCDLFSLLVERQSGDRGAINVFTRTPLTLDESLALPLDGLGITALGLTIPRPGSESFAVLPRLDPPAVSPADVERVLAEFGYTPYPREVVPPTVDFMQVTGTWAELAAFVARIDAASVSFGRN